MREMDNVIGRNINVLPDEVDDPELDAAWAEIDPAEAETTNAELNDVFREAEADRAAVDRLNAGIEDADPRLDPDVQSDEGAPDELQEFDNEDVGEAAFLPEDPTVTDDAAPGDVT
jgi:hypothetical protein